MSTQAKRRVAVMTGGGDCPGLNAVIRAAVKVGLNKGWEMLGIEDATQGLIDLNYRSPHGNRVLDGAMIRDLLTRGGTILGTTNRGSPFSYPVEVDGRIEQQDLSDRVLENFKKLGLSGLISIGGDGSMAIANRLYEKGLPVVGVPKTIDNDLAATDVTFGFDTAVQIATEALDRIRDTAESHDRVMLVELMGRNAGWIALHAGLAGGAHAILIPEIPYRIQPLVDMVNQRRERGEPFSVIVVAEGAKPIGGEASEQDGAVGGMPRLVGAAARVASTLEERLPDASIRVTVLGHIQRGGTPTSFDRILATRFGEQAAELIDREEYGHMVALRSPHIVSVPIADAVESPKYVDREGELVSTARALGVVFG